MQGYPIDVGPRQFLEVLLTSLRGKEGQRRTKRSWILKRKVSNSCFRLSIIYVFPGSLKGVLKDYKPA